MILDDLIKLNIVNNQNDHDLLIFSNAYNDKNYKFIISEYDIFKPDQKNKILLNNPTSELGAIYIITLLSLQRLGDHHAVIKEAAKIKSYYESSSMNIDKVAYEFCVAIGENSKLYNKAGWDLSEKECLENAKLTLLQNRENHHRFFKLPNYKKDDKSSNESILDSKYCNIM